MFADSMWTSVRERLFEEVDPASLVAFRVVYGVMAALSAARFFWYGWIDRFFYQRSFFFQFPGFEWVAPLPEPGMHVLFGVLVAAGIGIALGAMYRLSLSVFVVAFTYVGLVDTTNYLNHYWFFRFVGCLMLFMPLGRVGSVDAGLGAQWSDGAGVNLPAWPIWVLRLQLGLVYFFAGVAKLQWDWLVRGQPLDLWLSSRTHLPVIGPLLAADWLPHVMSIAGAVFDLSIAFVLFHPTVRTVGYAAVVGFHAATGWLFDIGMFPAIMIGLTPIFFAPSWPRRLLPERLLEIVGLGGRGGGGRDRTAGSLGATGRRVLVGGLAVWFAVQLALPLRHLLYPGDVSWTQEGFRFAWRVKVAERGGSLTYRARDPGSGQTWTVHPSRYLTRRQTELASADPSKILQLAHRIARDFERRGHPDVEVRADAFVALNGRPSRRLVDPEVDLADRARGLGHKEWILSRHEAERVGETETDAAP